MKLLREFFSTYTWRLAFRDAKPQWKSLLLYTSAVIAGVAALVAILSFRNDVFLTVDEQSRELLGADIEFRANQPYPDPVVSFIDSIGGSQAEAIEFNSMVQFRSSGDSRLSQIRAIDGPFPIYGTIETEPASAAQTYQAEGTALVEQSVMRQFNIAVGDTIQIGQVELPISGALRNVPGEAAAFSLIGPRIYVPMDIIEDSGLLQRGSRVQYKSYFEVENLEKVEEIMSEFRPIGREHNVRTETVESRKQDFDAIVDNLSKFLGLIAFIALLLGGLGVGSAVYVYIKRKAKSVATLRCLGMSSEKILATFSIQIAGVGFIGSAIGVAIGLMLQTYLPTLFTDFLPFEIVQAISYQAILLGLLIGIFISIGFSLLPLMSISGISPMLTLRTVDFSPAKNLSTRVKLVTTALSTLVLIGLITFVTDSLLASFLFALGVMVSVVLLWFTALLLMKITRKLRLTRFSYVWRQGIANLFRPNNQTPMLLTTLGMGMLLIGTLYLTQEMLLERIDLQSSEELPNLVLYDIQTDQNEGVIDIIEAGGGDVMQNVPIVSMRLQEWKNRPVSEVRQDTTVDLRGWALSREYRITYRSELMESETLLDGEWIGEADGIDSVVPISIATQIEEELEVGIGDTLMFDVQGVSVQTTVASIREVDFQRPEPNFFVVFPSGVLENAPQFYATIVRTGDEDVAYSIQQNIVEEYPNISAIDISVALQSVQEFLDKVSMAIQFMALFSILTGFIVLVSSIAISSKQRGRETVLLRTLGAVKKQVGSIQTIEYALLGLLASLTGLLLALVGSWALAYFYFDVTFVPRLMELSLISVGIIIASIAIGWSGSRHIFKKSPIEILRAQIQ